MTLEDDNVEVAKIKDLLREDSDSASVGTPRMWLIVLPVSLGMICLVAISVFSFIALVDTRTAVRNTNQLIEQAEVESGPEAQQQRAELLDQIIFRVDCNNREAMQELVRDLQIAGVPVTDISITDNCPSSPPPPPPPD